MSDPAAVPPELARAFAAYERALMGDDVEAMDRLFAPGATTLRGDADGLLVGHDAIAAFRRSRGGAPPRRLVQTHVQVVDDDHALVVAVTEAVGGGRGQQTQLWARDPGTGRWQVTAAHVSVSAPALDRRVWRVVGDPLLPGAGSGPLAGESVAVKDLYAVAGHRVGAGNPAWLEDAAVEPTTAPALQALLDAGADVRGIARTDELAYSLAGANAHHGTPPNPRAPHRVSGGSSSGSASAVSLGHATIGLGTDTAGSIRVPASYQGLWGIRTSHGAVDRTGLLPLAPSFDTVGWLTRSPALLRAVGEVLLSPDDRAGRADAADLTDLVVLPDLLDLADAEVAAAVGSWAGEHGAVSESADLGALPDWLRSFQRLQAWQAWQAHGGWLADRLDALGPDVRARFETGSRLLPDEAETARAEVEAAGAQVRALLGDRVLVLPSTSSVAPRTGAGLADRLSEVREATMRLTCLAGLAGAPAVSVPLSTADRLPCGACLVAAPGRDRDLLALAERLAGS